MLFLVAAYGAGSSSDPSVPPDTALAADAAAAAHARR
jgi:hypothetical protein